MTKITKSIVIILAVGVIGVLVFLLFKNRTAPDNLLGGDRDEHGCIGSAGYSWCEVKQKCLRIWEEPCSSELSGESIAAIKQLLADKYSYDIADVHLTIGQQTVDHLRGGVKFKDEGAGGIVLAAKLNGVWQIAFDGNGAISCQDMEKYNFPEAMISDCAPESGSGTVKVGYVKKLYRQNGKNSLDFDEVKWLSASDGTCVSTAGEKPDVPVCNPNGFLILNENEDTEIYEVTATTVKKTSEFAYSETGERTIGYESFVNLGAEHFAATPYAIEVADGTITKITEKYIP